MGKADALGKGKLATRTGFGAALKELGHKRTNIVVLDGDVKNSTYTDMFAQDPTLGERFFEARIAEQNMVSVGAGLAAAGKVPFISTFGKFLVRGYDQVEMAFISRLNIKLVGSHSGANVGADGPSQMGMSDVAFFRSYTQVKNPDGRPYLYILNPADGYAAYALTVAAAEHDGPCYLRTVREDTPVLYGADSRFALGGHGVIEHGTDLLVIAGGFMVHQAREAVLELRSTGIQATLVDLYSLPFDHASIAALARGNRGRVLTVEDDYGGGLGAAVAEALAETGEAVGVRQLFVRKIPKSARTASDVLAYVGLSPQDIANAGRRMIPIHQTRW